LYIYFLSILPDCGRHLTESTGNFSSPGYPNNYPNNAYCTWTITAPPGHVIFLSFTNFELHRDGKYKYCSRDFIEVYYDSSAIASSMIGRYNI